jgi:hypothetical protein
MVKLHEVLAGLPDRRMRKGRRYSLASIQTLALAVMLAGANDLLAIHRWGKRLTAGGLAVLGIDRGRAPAHATLHYVVRAIPAADLERAPAGSAMSRSTASASAAASTRAAPACIS